MANFPIPYKQGRFSIAATNGKPTLNLTYFTPEREQLEIMTYDGNSLHLEKENMRRGNISCQDLAFVLQQLKRGVVGADYNRNFDKKTMGLAKDALKELRHTLDSSL
jgi:hypothetical protein